MGNPSNSYVYDFVISADGRFVAFTSIASNLVPGDFNGSADVFIKDTLTGETSKISADSAGNLGNGNWASGSSSPAISADGRYVAFSSRASNLVLGDTNGVFDVFVITRQEEALSHKYRSTFRQWYAPEPGVTVKFAFSDNQGASRSGEAIAVRR